MSKSFADSCKDKLDTLINHELIVNGSYIVLKQILNLQEINNELLNFSVSFYRTVVNNCVSTIFIELAKEYDTSSKTLNLRSLLSDIKHNLHQLHDKSFSINLFSNLDAYYAESLSFDSISDFIDYAMTELNSVDEIVQRVKKLRDKYYAHLEKRFAVNPERLFSVNKITYEDLEKLLVLYANICNGLNVFFNDTTTFPLVIDCEDYDKTLHYIIKGIQAEQKEFGEIL